MKVLDSEKADTLLIGFDHAGEDNTVLVIGRKDSDKQFQIVNEFYGKEAEDLYKKLTDTRKEVQVIKGDQIQEVSFVIGPDRQEQPIQTWSMEEIYEMWLKRYWDERDPVINYWPHNILPNTIVIELHSGFEWLFQADKNGGHILNNLGRHKDV